MKKLTIFTTIFAPAFALFFLFSPYFAKAVCPVCTIAVGAGVGFSRWLGIDDVITGLWVGAVVISVSMWTVNWFKKREINFRFREQITYIGYIVIVIVPLYFMKSIWHPLNTIWGVNKLLLGIIIGGVFFYGTERLYDWMKKNNNNHAYFPFQKVVMPVVVILIWSLVFYYITK